METPNIDKELKELIEAAAEAAHEVNRAYCLALGDTSQVPWADAPDWQKESARKGACLHLFDHTLGAEVSHEAWLKEKAETGWKYGPVKDAEKKEHPCCVPFNELPREQQAKDYIFKAVVRASLALWTTAKAGSAQG